MSLPSKKRAKPTMKPADWENLPDEELMQIRIRDLGLRIEESPLAESVQRLYAELDARGLTFHPPCYLADEWFCPDKVPEIGIPFYLAHTRLKHLDQKMMFHVEGGTPASCMKLLRHETGHAVNYAYCMYKKTRWRELFGQFTTKYSDSYAFRPYSRRFVNHLEDNYAQAHPDEDFAETFAVWLTPNNQWEYKYRDWPAFRKLRYVDHLTKEISGQPPKVAGGETPWSAARLTSTLTAYYERRRKYLGEEFAGHFDVSLHMLFPGKYERGMVRASHFLRQHRRQVVSSVAAWTGQRKYDLHQILGRLIRRSDVLGLAAVRPPDDTIVDITAFITALSHKTGILSRRKRPL